MKTASRLQPALLLSMLMHVMLLGMLRLIPLLGLRTPAAPAPDVPVAVQLFDIPPTAPPLAKSQPEPPHTLPDALRQKVLPETPKTMPLPREPAAEKPKLSTPQVPRQGGTVVDLPRPVREERPDEARIIARYDSKAQDVGPGAGGSRKPSGAQPRTAPPEIPLPERYSKGQPSPPSAPLMPTTPVTPAPPSVSPPLPRMSNTPPAGAELPPSKPAAPTVQGEVLSPPLPPVPLPQTKPEPPARLATPATPRAQPEDKRPSGEAPPGPSARYKATAPGAPAPPRVAREEKRRPEAPAVPAVPQARTAPPPPAPPPLSSEESRRVETPPSTPSAPAAPNRPMTPEEQRRYWLTAQQELAMMQRDPQGRGGAGQSAGQHKQSLEEHFASLEKHQPLLSFDGPGVYERGPERSGEGPGNGEGGKYRSIASFGFKHVSYLLGMQRKIELVFAVPPTAASQGVAGIPIVGFTVRRSGELVETILLRSSGNAAVDQALMRAVRRAAPYQPFPNDLPEQEISIRIYATFS